MTGPGAIETDVLVIGAGPAGLFQVFELGLLEIGAHVVDALPAPGGQLIELYPDKPIYDIPGVPSCSARELVGNLLKQVEPFKPQLHLGQQVSGLATRDDGRFVVDTDAGLRFAARAVVVASGVGAFQPRRLAVDGLDRHVGTQVFFDLSQRDKLAGRHVVIVGGVDPALETAIELSEPGAQAPSKVTLIHRRDVFQAEESTIERFRTKQAAGEIDFIAGQVTAINVGANGRLLSLSVTHGDAQTLDLPADVVLVRQGLSPKLGPLADWGIALDRKQVRVDTSTYETNVPGIFAIGDAVNYPGKKKLILSGFHEAALASFGIAARLYPEQKFQLQYTTTSTRLHTLLGVTPPAG